jgi:hypothetical protein
MHKYIPVFVWLIFTLAAFFAVVYKAAMTAGSETHPYMTFKGYFDSKPLTVIFRFIVAQLFYFLVVQNPALLGGFVVGSMVEGFKASPIILAIALGLSSDKGADVLLTIGAWLLKKVLGAFQ